VSLTNNPKTATKLIIAFGVLLLIALCVSTCHAADTEFDLGYGRTLTRGHTDVAVGTVVWPRRIGNIDLYAGAILIGDYEYGGHRFGNQVIARAGITPHIGPLGVSLGLAAIQHDDSINSGRINFNLALILRLGRHGQAFLGHISNAGTSMPNVGRDFAGVEWRFR
jgi:hypothetical protein